jgi:hypothetical protein
MVTVVEQYLMIYCGSGSDFENVSVPDPDNTKHSFSTK